MLLYLRKWKDARVGDWAALEMRGTDNCSQGSNFCLSVIFIKETRARVSFLVYFKLKNVVKALQAYS